MSVGPKDRMEEQERIDYVLKEIERKETALYSKATGLKEDVIELRKTFWDDVTVNLDEPDDVIETQASIKQQAEFLAEKERFHGKIGDELKVLKRMKKSPYFGRIDFKEHGEDQVEKLYIGISSLLDKQDEDFLVYDWRAPISSLYYDYALGNASYNAVNSAIEGEISLKRQFIIREGVLKGLFDTGLTIGDEMLQEALGHNASTDMKNIVATIQKEQNRIIREERSKLLLVQGVAGSGKTSAALQRIAYLMYRYREELNPENVVLFSPNPLFTGYIRNVLPELGEANVRQTTFLEYLREGIGEGFTVESPFEQMEYVLTKENSDAYQTRLSSMEYKATLDFKKLIDIYVEKLRIEGMQFKNISFRGEILISKEEISEYFYALDEAITPVNKMEMVAKWLQSKLKQYQRQEVKKDWVMEKVELLDKEAYLKAYYEAQKLDEDMFVNEEKVLRKAVVRKMFGTLRKQIENFDFVHVAKNFRLLFSTTRELENTPNNWNAICEQTIDDLSNNHLTWEDAAPFLYFKGKLIGDKQERAVRQLLIDEAQDYSSFQFAFIRHLFPYTRMTLLGDINQAIYVNVTKENPLVPGIQESEHERITLTKSYRSTKQITEFTKAFAPGVEEIEAFNRDGDKPKLLRLTDPSHSSRAILAERSAYLEKGHKMIAVICKTVQETERVYKELKEAVPVTQITEETYGFSKGFIVLPVYLAKGIEFDAVIIPDGSSSHYKEKDRTLFYTACTRAMHDLTIISGEEPCSFIKEAKVGTYEMVEDEIEEI
ncbi:RNA polymerase recycling motor HelD [Oceanobacillus picturae]|uniref:RNA polymerase recycling motor HelD n=1 Tax=Oceanobacillus picturae TaxID=171693 RepID=UPI000E67B878|nr:RNA polymerase recycling motor HelD [Oceanobacillus picturae]RIU91999.1 helicase [Oceanobacillus picturae]